MELKGTSDSNYAKDRYRVPFVVVLRLVILNLAVRENGWDCESIKLRIRSSGLDDCYEIHFHLDSSN